MASGGLPGPSYSAVLSGGAAAFSLAADSYPGRPLPHTRPSIQGRHSHDHTRRPQDHIEAMASEQAAFFVPSYLRGSRHVERLEEAHRSAKVSGKDGRSNPSSNGGSLSTSSSSVNLHKMVPSHRGMTHEIIERVPTITEEPLAPLPSKWNELDKHTELGMISADGLEVKLSNTYKGTAEEAALIRADHSMPRPCGLYYYEVTVTSRSKEIMVAVGFTGRKTPVTRLPGWEPESWAYHGDDGHSFCCNQVGKPYGPKFQNGDVIGCGMNFRAGHAFFTKNGNFLGNAFKDIKTEHLYPAIGMKKPGETVRVNFGKTRFVFDIGAMMEKEKALIRQEVSSTSISSLSPRTDETLLIQKLISQYLAHDGYVDTARAFAQEALEEAQALSRGDDATIHALDPEEDHDAINRQRIRSALLEGDVDKALKLTNAFYPNVLKENENIYFQLRRRKFIEMIKKLTDLQTAHTKRSAGSNGHSNDYEGVFDHQMELDEQLNGNGGTNAWGKMDTEESDVHSKANDLTQEIIIYGQDLRSEFSKDPRREVKQSLETAFALMAYPDPKESILASMLDDEERVVVAEELNSAILVSLGKSSSAALERLCQQTEVLVSELSEDGGAGAFINVRKDFLRP